MVKQWDQPLLINKHRLPPGVFFVYQGPISQVLLFIFMIKVFIGILGESFEIQFLAICYIDFSKGFNQI